ncbi:MAG TPA: HD domain-containing protein, partial [Thermoanaerobaculia bacterium]
MEVDSSELLRQWLSDRNDPDSPALHSERVALLAGALASAMGIGDPVWIDALRHACAMHDIGKLAV